MIRDRSSTVISEDEFDLCCCCCCCCCGGDDLENNGREASGEKPLHTELYDMLCIDPDATPDMLVEQFILSIQGTTQAKRDGAGRPNAVQEAQAAADEICYSFRRLINPMERLTFDIVGYCAEKYQTELTGFEYAMSWLLLEGTWLLTIIGLILVLVQWETYSMTWSGAFAPFLMIVGAFMILVIVYMCTFERGTITGKTADERSEQERIVDAVAVRVVKVTSYILFFLTCVFLSILLWGLKLDGIIANASFVVVALPVMVGTMVYYFGLKVTEIRCSHMASQTAYSHNLLDHTCYLRVETSPFIYFTYRSMPKLLPVLNVLLFAIIADKNANGNDTSFFLACIPQLIWAFIYSILRAFAVVTSIDEEQGNEEGLGDSLIEVTGRFLFNECTPVWVSMLLLAGKLNNPGSVLAYILIIPSLVVVSVLAWVTTWMWSNPKEIFGDEEEE